MATFRIIDRAILATTSGIVATLTALMTVAVILGVFYRYVLNDALPWPEELARFSMLWIAWIGGGLALRRGAHVATDLLVSKLAQQPRRILVLIGNVLVLGFLLIILVNGVTLVERVQFQTTIALGISMQLPYLSAPLGAALMIYHLFVIMFMPRAAPAIHDSKLQV